MVARPHIVSVESAATGGIRSIQVDVAEDARSVRIFRDTDYDTSGDCQIGVNLVNVTSNPSGVLNIGADWNDLQGDGQQFSWTTSQQIAIQIIGRNTGAWTRSTSVPASSGQKPVSITAGQPLAGAFFIGSDGWLRPDFRQQNDFYVSFRTLEVPRQVSHRYTDLDKVKTILRAAQNREAGFDANFEERLNDCISSAEARIDAYCGRQFTASALDTRSFRVSSAVAIQTDDIDLSQTISITHRNRIVPVANYSFRRMIGYNVGRMLVPDRRNWYPQQTDQISVQAHFGWPEVPYEVRDYAGRLSAEIFQFDRLQSGLLTMDGGAVYGSQPGRHIATALKHLKAKNIG